MLKISDNYPKYVVTMDEFNSGTNYRGIAQIHIGDFINIFVISLGLFFREDGIFSICADRLHRLGVYLQSGKK